MKRIEQYVDQEVRITLNAKVTSETVEVGYVTRATPNSGGKEYVRLCIGDDSWRWNAPVRDWNDKVSADVEVEKRWVAE